MNKYIVRSRGVDYTVEADRLISFHGALSVEKLAQESKESIDGKVTKITRYESIAEFSDFEFWTQADKPLNIKTEDK